MLSPLQLLFPATSARERCEQIRETFRGLRKQIPLLYAVALTNLVGMHVSTDGAEFVWISPITWLSALLVWRMIYWLFLQADRDDLSAILRELYRLIFFTVVLCAGFAIWAQSLITRYPDQTEIILLYGTLAALGAAYGLASFPRAAILPLLILGIPVAGRLLFMDGAANRGLGVSLCLVLMLFMRLLYTHNEALAALVGNKFALKREHDRAVRAERAARERADRDVLTGLANRALLLSEIENRLTIGSAVREGSVLAISDLDGFKPANDAFGHAAGDAILREFGDRLVEAFGSEAVVARIGGDEFALFWPDGLSAEAIANRGDRIIDLASRPISWEGKKLRVGVSCGVTQAGPRTHSQSEFLRQADSALYKAKEAGKGAWRLYDSTLLELDWRRSELERLLLGREFKHELAMVYQPIVCCDSSRIHFLEALARWKSADFGDISPPEFIRTAERLGMISQLNEWLLERALESAGAWDHEVGLSFNLSAAQIGREGAADRLLEVVRNSDVSPSRVQFEVTETAFLAEISIPRREIEILQNAGCRIALDDFGAGHASISCLLELAFDVVKFDGCLIRNIERCSRSRGIVLSLIELCHAANTPCVAEHVETIEQFELLRAMGCDFAQGYHFGQPQPDGQVVHTRRAFLE